MNQMTQADFRTVSPFRLRYDNFIGGAFVPPKSGRYMDNITPITGAKVCEVARSGPEDIEAALDAAHAAREAWGGRPPPGCGLGAACGPTCCGGGEPPCCAHCCRAASAPSTTARKPGGAAAAPGAAASGAPRLLRAATAHSCSAGSPCHVARK